MNDYFCIKSNKKYTTTLYYPNKTKVIDTISLNTFNNEIINVFHMNFETYGNIDYSIKLYKNMDLIYNIQIHNLYNKMIYISNYCVKFHYHNSYRKT